MLKSTHSLHHAYAWRATKMAKPSQPAAARNQYVRIGRRVSIVMRGSSTEKYGDISLRHRKLAHAIE